MPISQSYLERNLARFTEVLQHSVFAETVASRPGWSQQMDPRVKCGGFFLLLIAAALSHHLWIIASLYLLSLVLAAGSGVFSLYFLRRVWIFMPLYTALIALPALFLTPGDPLLELPAIRITQQGARTASFLILRVATSVSFMLLLVLTTSWPRLLKALRALGLPKFFVFLLAVTYRYIYVLLDTAGGLFLARKSRKVGPEAWPTTRQWIGGLLAALLGKSIQLSHDVYLAMQSRGFRGEPVLLNDFRFRRTDFVWLIFFLTTASAALYFGLA